MLLFFFFFFFDNLKEDHASSVRRIAKFMGVDCNEEVAHVVHTTSHAEMSRHAIKFDTCKIVLKLSEKIGEEPTPEGEFEGKQKLPLEIQQCIE